MSALAASFAAARRPLLILDYDGTLVPLAPTPEAATPSPALLSLLSHFIHPPASHSPSPSPSLSPSPSAHSHSHSRSSPSIPTGPESRVHIISGRDAAFLTNILRPILPSTPSPTPTTSPSSILSPSSDLDPTPRLTLTAEHGAFSTLAPSQPSGSSGSTDKEALPDLGYPWYPALAPDQLQWIPAVHALFQDFAKGMPGTIVERKLASVVFHYRLAEQSSVSDQLIEIERALGRAFPEPQRPFVVVPGKMILEVRMGRVDKGQAVRALLARPAFADVDFILCAGDDTTDEDMFKVLAQDGVTPCPKKDIHTVLVGHPDRQTAATARVSTVSAFIDLLASLANNLDLSRD